MLLLSVSFRLPKNNPARLNGKQRSLIGFAAHKSFLELFLGVQWDYLLAVDWCGARFLVSTLSNSVSSVIGLITFWLWPKKRMPAKYKRFSSVKSDLINIAERKVN